MKNASVDINSYELECMKSVLTYWEDLSNDPHDTSAMADHCHIEADVFLDVIMRIDDALK